MKAWLKGGLWGGVIGVVIILIYIIYNIILASTQGQLVSHNLFSDFLAIIFFLIGAFFIGGLIGILIITFSPLRKLKNLGGSGIIRIILLFLFFYILFGISHTFFTGDHNFFKEFSINKGDAIFISFLWPAFFVVIGGFIWDLVGIVIASFISLIILIFFLWLAYVIERKFFSKEVMGIQQPQSNPIINP